MAKHKAKTNKFITGAVTAAMVATAVVPVAAAAGFTDTSNLGDQVKSEVNKAVDLGFFKDGEKFNPSTQINRGQATLTLARYIAKSNDLKAYVTAQGLDTGAAFKDVPESFKDGEDYQAELYYASLIVKKAGAFTQENLNATGKMTRSQMAKVITETFKLEKAANYESKITDINHLDAATKGYIETLASNEVTNVTTFNPAGEVTRSQMASFLVRSYDAVNAGAAIASVTAINATTIQVTFKGDLTEEQANKANFSLSKGEIEAVKVEGKVATISVKGLTYGDKTTVKIADPAHSAEVTIPEVSEIYVLDVTTDAANDTIKSDGAAKTQVTVTLRDKVTGEVIKEDGIVQFQATRGGLGQTTSALQDGKATVQLTSVASATSMTSIITATVSDVPGAAEFEGLTAQKAVIFSPDATDAETKFVQVMAAESTQGDRLHVQFSDKISAEAYKKEIEKKVAPAKVKATDYGIQIHGKDVAVKDVVQLTDNTLEFILDVDSANPSAANSHLRIENGWGGAIATSSTQNTKNYLRDNVTHVVSVPSNIGGLVLANAGVSFILTDTSRPAVLGVTAKDQLEFTVRFTESIDERTVEAAPENFLLDGRKVRVNANPSAVDIAAAKQVNEIILTSLKVGEYTFDKDGKPVDNRNKATFTVHKDFALAGGVHQIQIAKVSDWAGDVDPNQNILATDTFDFTVNVDNSIPVPTIEVQSAEQWLVSFDKLVSSATGKTAKEVFKVATADSSDQALVYGTDYKVYALSADGIYGKELTENATINAEDKFLIEFTKDWSEYYKTNSNPTDTYFASKKNPYTVTVENLESLVGNKIAKQVLDVKLSYDGVSPTITSAVDVSAQSRQGYRTNTSATSFVDQKLAGKAVLVNMSEPIQMNNPGTLNAEGLTPSQTQTSGVPTPTYEFVKGDKVIKAEVATSSLAADDKSFVLVPTEELEEGTWTLFIRSISDDIGNTSATVSSTVVVPVSESAVTKTQMAWAAFDDADGTGKLVPGAQNDPDFDAIYVKFTQEMKSDGANGVSRTQNYVFRGQPLPAGSQVVKGIKDVTSDWDGVTILMPKGSWDGVNNAQNDFGAAFNIASNFQSAKGETLSGAFEVELKDTTTVKTPSSTLSSGFEALYTGKTYGTVGNDLGKAAVLGATAKSSTPGKVDAVELKLEHSVIVDKDTVILVNGKKYHSAAAQSGSTLTFTALNASSQIDGTTTDKLVVTTNDGAILVNKTNVVDKVGAVITSAALNAAGDQIKITFSESINQSVINSTDFSVAGGGTVSGSAIEVGDNYVVLAAGAGFTATSTVNVIAAPQTVKDKANNPAVALGTGVKVTGITTGTGPTVTGVTATSATMAQQGITNVPASAATASAIGNLTFGGFTNNALAGYQIKVVENTTAVPGDAAAAATLDLVNKVITVTAESLADVTATNIEGAIQGLNTAFTGVGLAAEATAVTAVTATLTGGAATAGTSTITAGSAGVTGQTATANFKVATGATKTGTVTVKISVNDNGTVTDYTNAAAINVVAGHSASTVASAIQGATYTGAPFALSVTGETITITQNPAKTGVTYTVSVQ